MTTEALLLCIKENNVTDFKKIVNKLTKEEKIALSTRKIYNPVTRIESTLLMSVVMNNQVDILHELLKIDAIKANVIKKEYLKTYEMTLEETPLTWAAKNVQVEIILELLVINLENLKLDINMLNNIYFLAKQQFVSNQHPVYLLILDKLLEIKCVPNTNPQTWKNCFYNWIIYRNDSSNELLNSQNNDKTKGSELKGAQLTN